MSQNVVQTTSLKELPLIKRGKVRDVYDMGDALLIVATDRISCFDVVLPTPIPGKGAMLTRMSEMWFGLTRNVVRNHFRSAEVPAAVTNEKDRRDLQGRVMVVDKADALPVEAIVRGYLSGSGWVEYQRSGTVCGIRLPARLGESEKLPEPIYTPSTKAPDGAHDENIAFEKTCDILGARVAEDIRRASLRLYKEAADYAARRGIIIADTKFEFGLVGGELTLIDEVLTPDSSRFWPAGKYAVGRSQPSFDKQYVRDYLNSIGWDHNPPAPELPDAVVRETASKYREALRLLTQNELDEAELPGLESAR
ncbi:MAG: phosphoribosylaminoimidazolesuccinocarboxamide synthase [Lentisphaerae bacterium]|nr:phosphoribosylaminoimidazolesuccinocarboxamide synthase [Lentisphaerota bacterium]